MVEQKKIAIHQPNYMPWMGYFIKMAMSDVFVFHDWVEHTKSGMTRRVKIADCNHSPSSQWLTLPLKKHSDFSRIIDLELSNEGWVNIHLEKIKVSYRSAPYFHECYRNLSNLLIEHKNEKSLSCLNCKLIKGIASILGLRNIQFLNSSEIENLEGLKSDDLNLAIVKNLGGDIYLSGLGGKNYQSESLFEDAHIDIAYIDSMQILKEYNYSQVIHTENYGVSIVDMWMNVGLDEMKKFVKLLS